MRSETMFSVRLREQFALAEAASSEGRHREAIEYLTTIIAVRPTGNSYRWRAEQYQALDNAERALSDMDRYVSMAGTWDAYLARADMLTHFREYDRALSDVRRVLERQPGHEGARTRLARLEAMCPETQIETSSKIDIGADMTDDKSEHRYNLGKAPEAIEQQVPREQPTTPAPMNSGRAVPDAQKQEG